MRGVLVLCLVYATLPLFLLALGTVIQSGFPLLPLATWLAIFYGNRRFTRSKRLL